MHSRVYFRPVLRGQIVAGGAIEREEAMPSAYIEALRKEIGTSNWVVHRRTRRIVEKYGEDAVCLSHKRYLGARR